MKKSCKICQKRIKDGEDTVELWSPDKKVSSLRFHWACYNKVNIELGDNELITDKPRLEIAEIHQRSK